MPELTQKTLPCGHIVTIEGGLKMGEFRRWMTAEKEAKYELVYPYLAKLVKVWDWPDLDPKDPDSYDQLDMDEYRQVVEAVSQHIVAATASKN